MLAVQLLEADVGRVLVHVVAADVEVRRYAQQIAVDRCGEDGNGRGCFEHGGHKATGWVPYNGLGQAADAAFAALDRAEVGDRERLLWRSGNWKCKKGSNIVDTLGRKS